ncbi:hypothetical protein [Coleofasciculus sp. F4-SAH-05]|uniref:hypothetical protein n=1 Tax=Coleofasciculus sp. F4-SAH-05 TaxID=3069525 RepID=UPI0033054247
MQGWVDNDTLILTFKQQHPKQGEIKEEWISKFSLKETRIIPKLVIREREIVFTNSFKFLPLVSKIGLSNCASRMEFSS